MSRVLLALDTATSAISAAVLLDGVVRAERAVIDPRRHSEVLAPTVESVLREADIAVADLTAVAVGIGPGPFTGLRVGIVTATTLGFARGIPAYGVCSLDALAEQFAGDADGEFVVATDARRKEVYWAGYRVDDGVAHRLTDPAVCRPADLPDDVRALPAVGRGGLLYPDLLPHRVGPLDVSAGALGRVARRRLDAGTEQPVRPLYLRRPDVNPNSGPKPTLLPGVSS
ncbi:MAG: tRNA (adenosine(37)-N6)-threonylcarbamoyltransferase complex dimerization subunit type 1 TsaB [Dermatophilaceae bacterium]